MSDKRLIPLSRQELRRFLPDDFNIIKTFENLFRVAQAQETGSQEIDITGSNAVAKTNQLAGEIEEVKKRDVLIWLSMT